MIETIIIESSNHEILNVKKILSKYCPQLHITNNCNDILATLKYIERRSHVLLIINAKMFIHSREETCTNLALNNEIILVADSYDYVPKVCQYGMCGYLLKPIDPEGLIAAVGIAKRRIQSLSLIHI